MNRNSLKYSLSVYKFVKITAQFNIESQSDDMADFDRVRSLGKHAQKSAFSKKNSAFIKLIGLINSI